MEVKKIAASDFSLEVFDSILKDIYEPESLRHAQRSEVNYRHLNCALLLFDAGKVIARVAIYNNLDLFFEGKKVVCFGNYECIDDDFAANKILNAATAIALELGAKLILGPMNGSTWDTHRFSIEHDEPNFFLEPYHHLYYNEQFLSNDFYVFAKYFSSKDDSLMYDFPFVLERENAFLAEGVTFRNIDLAHFDKELELLYNFNSIAFQTNFLYTPIEKEDFLQKYQAAKQIINPEFVILAEDKQRELIGYFFCVQDFYNTKEKSLIIKTIARHPDKKWAGLGYVIGNRIYRKAVENAYSSVIHAFMFDEGYSISNSKVYSGQRFKNYHLYGKGI